MKIRILLIFLLVILYQNANSQIVDYPFAEVVNQFKRNDSISPPPSDATFFIGSSSFTIWNNVQDDFMDIKVVNRAFGGSTLVDQIRYIEDIVIPFKPERIIIYCGENDLAFDEKLTASDAEARFVQLFQKIRSQLPDVMIVYVSMKPSPSRWHLSEKFFEANQMISNFIDSQSNSKFISIWKSMLNKNYLPDSTLFLDDMLHMNAKGYMIWKKEISAIINSK
ncbi:MAG: G-D-S-L family lipolytic protein [Bacteroidetes bacterium]|nr:MAG: G-D-S-L family lipolytic protein [Bacteroidota bacterium]